MTGGLDTAVHLSVEDLPIQYRRGRPAFLDPDQLAWKPRRDTGRMGRPAPVPIGKSSWARASARKAGAKRARATTAEKWVYLFSEGNARRKDLLGGKARTSRR